MRSMTTTMTSATMGKEQLDNSAMQLVKAATTTESNSNNEHPSRASPTKTTTSSKTTSPINASSTKSFTKNAFRFPKRFSLRSPSMNSTSASTGTPTKKRHSTTSATTATTASSSSSPVNGSITTSVNTMTVTPTYRKLRSFPLSLRIRANPSNAATPVEHSETSAMTSLSPQEGGGCNSSSASSSASNNSSSSSTKSSSSSPLPSGLRDCRRSSSRRHHRRRRRRKEREAREDDFVMRCTKIVTVQNDSPGEQQQQQQEEEQEQETTTTTIAEEEAEKEDEVQQQEAEHQDQQQQPPQSPSSSSSGSSNRQGADQQIQPYRGTEQQGVSTTLPGYSCATAILQHSYLEMVCGRRGSTASLPEDQQEEEYHQQQQEANNSKLYGPQSTPPPKSSSALSSSSSVSSRRRRIPDDPTVQDSIECVFASQLEEGLPLWDVEEEDDDDDTDDEYDDPSKERRDEREHLHTIHSSYEEEPINAPSEAELPSPAPLMQSRQKSRTPLPTVTKAMIPNKRRSHPSNNHTGNRFHVLPKKNSYANHTRGGGGRRKKYQTAKMVHVGTFDPRTNRILEVAETDHNLMEEDPAVRVAPCTIQSPPRQGGTCFCHSQSVPVVPSEYWPQAPLLLRPTPGEDITVLGIRKSGQTNHFWTPADGGWWLTPLYELAGKEAPSLPPGVPSMCPHCCLLPINNGNEAIGEALVTDFQTPLFEGSLLVRLRHVEGGATTTNPDELEYDDSKGYFAGLNRRYQVVIRGKFKKEMPLTSIVAGCVMDRPVGRLPPKWIMKGAVKVLSFFAPQLEVQMDSPRPKTVAPLGSTPQALVVEEVGPQDTLPPLDAVVEEPKNAMESLLGESYHGNTSLQRARGRKKAFDKLYAAKSKHPMTKTSSGSKETYYTFEFLQHLVNFQDFSVELGNLLGSLPIAPILSGQPIPIMAMAKEGEQKLWSFDIWHHNLVEGAKEHDAKSQSSGASQ